CDADEFERPAPHADLQREAFDVVAKLGHIEMQILDADPEDGDFLLDRGHGRGPAKAGASPGSPAGCPPASGPASRSICQYCPAARRQLCPLGSVSVSDQLSPTGLT